mmetsp:Transcript_29145/g.35517  ORF Transcript_29145/g.35517 Transcript_29145/m.35517 type:complete len:81 (+) Transcript_29145:75-317(+)
MDEYPVDGGGIKIRPYNLVDMSYTIAPRRWQDDYNKSDHKISTATLKELEDYIKKLETMENRVAWAKHEGRKSKVGHAET